MEKTKITAGLLMCLAAGSAYFHYHQVPQPNQLCLDITKICVNHLSSAFELNSCVNAYKKAGCDSFVKTFRIATETSQDASTHWLAKDINLCLALSKICFEKLESPAEFDKCLDSYLTIDCPDFIKTYHTSQI